jgi:hypothetical protein
LISELKIEIWRQKKKIMLLFHLKGEFWYLKQCQLAQMFKQLQYNNIVTPLITSMCLLPLFFLNTCCCSSSSMKLLQHTQHNKSSSDQLMFFFFCVFLFYFFLHDYSVVSKFYRLRKKQTEKAERKREGWGWRSSKASLVHVSLWV